MNVALCILHSNLITCHLFFFLDLMKYSCRFRKKEFQNCVNLKSGTIAFYNLPPSPPSLSYPITWFVNPFSYLSMFLKLCPCTDYSSFSFSVQCFVSKGSIKYLFNLETVFVMFWMYCYFEFHTVRYFLPHLSALGPNLYIF